MNTLVRLGALTVGLFVFASTASAQVIGTFRWQFSPYCNVVTLLVEQKGSVYELTGTDDQCGGAVLGSARGTAHLNPGGTSASISLTVIRPDGIPVGSAATINLITLSGTWSDQFRNGGDFVFSPPAAPGGGRRPIRIVGNWAINFNAAGVNSRGTDSISFGMLLPTAPTAVGANYIAEGAAPTVNCPGSSTSPDAVAGNLCLYSVADANHTSTCIARTGASYACGLADRSGASMYVTSTAAGQVVSAGRWVVVIP
jgi:hypothetical protein